MNIETIKARDLPDAWIQCVYYIFDKGYEYTIDRGSFKGQKRIEYDYIVVHISYPGYTRPLIPDMPPGCGVPPPTSMEYVEQYLEKLITSIKGTHETYTYGEDLEKQIDEVIRMYREEGHNTNQAYMAVGNASSLLLEDPQCLRGVDTEFDMENSILYISEWYMTTAARPDYVHAIFEKQCEYALKNLETLIDMFGDRVHAVVTTGTDFGTQNSLFISKESYRDLFEPYHQKLNELIHQKSNWKIFIPTLI